ncbi:AraC family transcriptional regulator [Nocardioides glacieisoli]|uniref:AraC family transcriptional regulator n=1 Tax=Nocardioides glacieisoli TaxID=1168730 RepID=A0A4Q2S6G9_9ACTN|nr:GyrI-like domain-containing protein [Nocardioides glacieisoli]RYB96184.1 AraC family transcriptional regulator [Nocardioides glacieisoli]
MTDLAPAQPYDHAARVELDSVPLAVIRHAGVTLGDIRTLFDDGYGAIAALIGTGAITPTGPALAIYKGDVEQAFDLELGFPVANALSSPLTAGERSVVPSTLPSGPAVAATHLGSYDDLGEAWGRLADAAGAQPTGSWIEVYVSDPSQEPDHLRTDLLMPVTG